MQGALDVSEALMRWFRPYDCRQLSDSPHDHDSTSNSGARASSSRIITHRLRAHTSRCPPVEMGRYPCHEELGHVTLIPKACGSVHSIDLLVWVDGMTIDMGTMAGESYT